MTETTTDWGVLARALAADGVAEELLFEPSGLEVCGNPDCRPCAADVQAWRASGRVLRDFRDPAVIFPVAEVWRALRRGRWYTLTSQEGVSDSAAFPAYGLARQEARRWTGHATDDPANVAEALARALLAWAEAQEVRDGE